MTREHVFATALSEETKSYEIVSIDFMSMSTVWEKEKGKCCSLTGLPSFLYHVMNLADMQCCFFAALHPKTVY